MDEVLEKFVVNPQRDGSPKGVPGDLTTPGVPVRAEGEWVVPELRKVHQGRVSHVVTAGR